jgi:hypothetical protein
MSFASDLKTIVVATDLSGRPEAALEHARKLAATHTLAQTFQRPLILLHAHTAAEAAAFLNPCAK